MSKNSYVEKSEKCVKFLDFGTHLHKSTFKGLAAIYLKYQEIQNYYSSSLLSLSNSFQSQIVDFKKQAPAIKTIIKQIINSIQVSSQIHFNYSEKLKQASEYYNTQYLTSKKKKQQLMRLIKDKHQLQYQNIKQKRNQQLLSDKEKQHFKTLYEKIGQFFQDEKERTRKLREQSVISFSLAKKITEKQAESITGHIQKLTKTQLNVKYPGLEQIQQEIVAQYNSHDVDGLDVLRTRNYQLRQSMQLKRSQIRQSIAFKQRVTRVESARLKMTETVEKYQKMPDSLLLITSPNKIKGIFADHLVSNKNKRFYAKFIDTETLQYIYMEMMCKYWLVQQYSKIFPECKVHLQIIKASLKVYACKPTKAASNWSQFLLTLQKNDKIPKYQKQLWFLLNLNKLYQKQLQEDQLYKILSNNQQERNFNLNQPSISGKQLHLTIAITIIDTLLQGLITVKQDENLLSEGYSESLRIICSFSNNFLNVNTELVVLIFLKKIARMLDILNIRQSQQIELLNKLNWQQKIKNPRENENQQIVQETNNLLNYVSTNIFEFHTGKNSLINLTKICLVLQKISCLNSQNFSSMEHLHKSICCAGFNYINSKDEIVLDFDGQVWKGQQRLRNLVELLEKLQYDDIEFKYLQPAAAQISIIQGVGRQVLQSKLFEQFIKPCLDLIDINLSLIAEQGGADKEGYILKLGIILVNLDQKIQKPFTFSEKYFKVLQSYLYQTEKAYDQMLERSRQTQIWIAEQNSQATRNCIDFCSLLTKPFEFLLDTVKQLEKTTKSTQFNKKFSEIIKKRLNNTLTQQIIKYINFLFDSLKIYKSDQPELKLKPKRVQKVQKRTQNQFEAQKILYKQITRRMYNLIFLKDQLEQIVSDFIQEDIYQQIDNSVFNVEKFKKLVGRSHVQNKQMLENILLIVENILKMQQEIIKKIANITIFYFWKTLFNNLYWQEEKNTLGEFLFATKPELSKYTLVEFQVQIQQELVLISKSIPDDYIDSFVQKILQALYKALKFQILNTTKFKIAFKQPQLIKYLQTDINFLEKIMKQRFFSEKLVDKYYTQPLTELLKDREASAMELMNIFQKGTVKNDKNLCTYAIILLSLKVNDQKAQQFYKKYKNTIAQ